MLPLYSEDNEENRLTTAPNDRVRWRYEESHGRLRDNLQWREVEGIRYRSIEF